MKKAFHVLQAAGILLICASLGLLLYTHLHADSARTAAKELAGKIEASLPERSAGLPDSYTSSQMPILQIDGQDFVGLIQAPDYGCKLPVYDRWDTGKLQDYPCRFTGSVYDSSLIIGGSGQTGQFDFFSRLDIGERITVTDMLGAEFCYRVARVDRADHAEAERLINEEFDLTLFARSPYALEYMIVRCTLSP